MTTTEKQTAGPPGYDLFVVEFEGCSGTTLVPVGSGEGSEDRIGARWLPLAPRTVRRARAVSFGKATAHAGAARVRQAIATAEQRRRRTAPDDKRLATAARIVRLLSRIGEAADAAGVEIAVGASSPRGQIPGSAPAEDHHILLRIAAGRTTIKVTAAPEAPSEPTVVHGGRLWDVTVPGFYETARELAAEQSGRRPPALSVETLVQLSTQLDATRFAARFGNTGNTQDEEQITLVGLAEQLLLRCWPVTTPGNRNQTWCIPVASGYPGRRQAATAALERHGSRVVVNDAGIERYSAEGPALDGLVNHLTAAAKLRAHPRWTSSTSRYLIDARRNRRLSR